MPKLQLMLIAVLLGGAGTLAGCGPSIDPALKADIDRRNSMLGPPTQSFPAPAEFVPKPLQVGQWTQHRMVRDQEPSFLTYKVVGQIADAFWVESVLEGYTGRTVTKILLVIPNRTDPNSIEIRGVVMKDRNGHVNSFDGPMLQMMQGMYRGAVSNLIVSWQGQPQEDAVVPAGRFSGCFKMRSDAQWGPWKTSSTSWSHPAVPLSGMVRSEGIDHPSTMELIAFGLSGAVSEL
ncbi:MAG TPA: hypothetical protein VFH68_11990 [Polyangia bacterium]|nr:hypothetical protein [Polyangia bacterium]